MHARMNMLSKIAAMSDHHQHKHVVIVVRGGQIVATGYNHGHIHAEVNALSKVWPNRRKGLRVYSFRLRRDGCLGMAKPCPQCEDFLRRNGVKQVYFSNNQSQIEVMKL